MTLREETLEAWHQWDEAPSNSQRANAWMDATKSLGLPYNIRPTCVQEVLSAFRRAGYPRGVCMDAFIAAAQLIRERMP